MVYKIINISREPGWRGWSNNCCSHCSRSVMLINIVFNVNYLLKSRHTSTYSRKNISYPNTSVLQFIFGQVLLGQCRCLENVRKRRMDHGMACERNFRNYLSCATSSINIISTKLCNFTSFKGLYSLRSLMDHAGPFKD